ncbi:DEAD/DEAH box helicase [Klebsiella pneumoniae]
MNISAVFESAGLSLRKVQQDYIEAAAGALTQDHKVALISAETGVGKTLGYLVPALLILLKNPEAKFVIATNSHALMHQIFRSDRPLLEQIAEQCGIKVTFSRLMGKANYVSLEKVRGLLLMDEFTDLDTVKVLEKLANWSKPLVGIRSENDTVRIIILDPRFPEPTDLSSKHRSLEHIIPVRFRREYRSCEILSPAYCEEDIQC